MAESAADYITIAGWQLCLIEPGSKGPRYAGWNSPDNALTDPDIAAIAPGVGLLHAYSKTCAIDVDALIAATEWCEQRGIMLPGYLSAPNSVHLRSGRPNRDKLLYRLDKPLRTIKPEGSGLEFRCAAANGWSMQDALPPTIHPDTGKPYILTGCWWDLPPLPTTIYNVWRDLVSIAPPETLPAGPSEVRGPADYEHLRSLTRGRDPNCGYDEWLQLGMGLHDKCNGGMEGLAIWDAWSKLATGKASDGSPKYPGLDLLRRKWLTFKTKAERGGVPSITVGSLERMVPAQPEEFEVQTPPPEDSGAAAPPVAQAPALQQLQERLVYVEARNQYFDLQGGRFIANDNALYTGYAHMFGPPRRNRRHDVVKMLAESPGRVVVEDAVCRPGESELFMDGDATYLNLYRDVLPEPLEPMPLEREAIELLFNRIDDVDFREWLRQFYGHMVQRPGVKIRSAPLMWSRIEGSGKTTMMSTIPKLLAGAQYSQEVSYVGLEEKFNGFLTNKWHICMTELKVGSRKDAEAVMTRIKPWISDDFVEVRAMRTDSVNIRNHLVITATSNKADALLLTNQDRRFAVCELRAPALTSEEKDLIFGLLNSSRGPGVLRHYFLNVPIGNFDHNAEPPRTEAKREMIAGSQGDEVEALRELWMAGDGIFSKDAGTLLDVQKSLRLVLGYNVSFQRLGYAMKDAVGAQKREIKRFGETISRNIWVWRNPKWISCSQQELLDYIDSYKVGV